MVLKSSMANIVDRMKGENTHVLNKHLLTYMHDSYICIFSSWGHGTRDSIFICKVRMILQLSNRVIR